MITEKIKIVLLKKNMSVADLARLLDVTPQNLYNKFKRNNFSEKEIADISAVLGVEFECSFVMPDGSRV